MKRWDHSLVAENIKRRYHALAEPFSTVLNKLAHAQFLGLPDYLDHKKIEHKILVIDGLLKKTQANKLARNELQQLQKELQEMQKRADTPSDTQRRNEFQKGLQLLFDIHVQLQKCAHVAIHLSTNQYPLENTEDWMFEGFETTLRQRFAEGVTRERAADIILKKLNELQYGIKQYVATVSEADKGCLSARSVETLLGSLHTLNALSAGLYMLQNGGPLYRVMLHTCGLWDLVDKQTQQQHTEFVKVTADSNGGTANENKKPDLRIVPREKEESTQSGSATP